MLPSLLLKQGSWISAAEISLKNSGAQSSSSLQASYNQRQRLASKTQEERAACLLQASAFSNRVLHNASSLRGTKQYWQRQWSRLCSVVDRGTGSTHHLLVQQISSGQSRHSLSALTTLTPELPMPNQISRTQPLTL